jgi:hypothetical protein
MITASVCFSPLAYHPELLIMDSRMIGLMFLANHSHLNLTSAIILAEVSMLPQRGKSSSPK